MFIEEWGTKEDIERQVVNYYEVTMGAFAAYLQGYLHHLLSLEG